MQEKTDQRFCSERQHQGGDDAADDRSAHAETEGFAHPTDVAGTVVEADDGLRGLGNGVVDHDDDGVEIAGHAEGGDAVFTQSADEDVVARQQNHRHGQLAQHRREAAARHVADVACRQISAGEAELQAAQMKRLRAERHIPDNHARRHGTAECRGQSASGNAHLQGKHKQPVQKDVEQAGDDLQHGGKLGRGVEAYDEGADQLAYDEDAAGQDEEKILAGQRHEGVAAAQKAQEGLLEDIDEDGKDQHQQRGHLKGLRDVDVGGFVVAPREMDAGHNRNAGAEHQRHARGHQKQRRHNVDGRQRIAAHTLSHEDAVGHREEGGKHHRQQRGIEEAVKQRANP